MCRRQFSAAGGSGGVRVVSRWISMLRRCGYTDRLRGRNLCGGQRQPNMLAMRRRQLSASSQWDCLPSMPCWLHLSTWRFRSTSVPERQASCASEALVLALICSVCCLVLCADFARSHCCSFADAMGLSDQSQCLACLPGSKCSTGSLAPTACSPGSYAALQRSAECTPCAASTYQSQSGSTACQACEAGAVCPAGSATPVPW